MKELLVVLGGPTGVGKTAAAIALAQKFNTEIISSDSRQVFKELSIGTALPSARELNLVPHHFIQSHSIESKFNASVFENEVLQKLETLFTKHNMVVMVGGSGLYIDAVCNGIDDLPTIPAETRNKYHQLFEIEGIEKLQELVKKCDPEYYKKVDLNNYKRLQKALEIYDITGKPYSSHLKHQPKQRNFNILRIALNIDRELLYNRINNRTDKMIEAGLEEEARSMISKKNITPLKTVGYSEFFDYFDGQITKAEAIEQIKNHTRAYARRQLTWFRKHKDTHWFEPEQIDEMSVLIESKLNAIA